MDDLFNDLDQGTYTVMADGTAIDTTGADSSPAATSQASESNARKRMHMIAISEEKATMASNYIAFYGFLNILAVGLLFYIAKA